MRCRPAAAFSTWVTPRYDSVATSRATDLQTHTQTDAGLFEQHWKKLVGGILPTRLQCIDQARLGSPALLVSCLSRQFSSVLSEVVLAPLEQRALCASKDVCGCLTPMPLSVCVCALRCLPLLASSPLSLQAHIKRAQLLQKAWVGTDVSVGPHSSHGLLQRQALSDHQEGQHQCGRTAHSHQAMHKHFSWERNIIGSHLHNRIRRISAIRLTCLPLPVPLWCILPLGRRIHWGWTPLHHQPQSHNNPRSCLCRNAGQCWHKNSIWVEGLRVREQHLQCELCPDCGDEPYHGPPPWKPVTH